MTFKTFPELLNANSYCVCFFSTYLPKLYIEMILVPHVSIYAFGIISSDIISRPQRLSYSVEFTSEEREKERGTETQRMCLKKDL